MLLLATPSVPRFGEAEDGDRQRGVGHPDAEAGRRPRDHHQRDREVAERGHHARDPEGEEREARGHHTPGAGGEDPPLLDPCGRRPAQGGAGERDAGHPGGLVAHLVERERHVGVGAEEREREDASHHHRGRHAGRQAQRPSRHERDEGAHRDRGGHEQQRHREPRRRSADGHEDATDREGQHHGRSSPIEDRLVVVDRFRRPSEHRDGDDARDHDEREESEEHGPPAEGVLDGAARCRPDQPGHHPGGGEHGEHTGRRTAG
jgi:hypothetical protein